MICKTLFLYAGCAVYFLALVSCHETSSAEHEAVVRRNNVLGAWAATMTTRLVRQGEVISESSGAYDLVFHTDGTGSNQNLMVGQPDVPFEWLYQFDPERYVLIYDRLQLFTGLQFFVFEVEKSETKMQVWTMTVADPFNCPTCDYAEYTLTLTRE